MIILITGTPGSGKTLFTVSELLAGQFKDRPLFINGIPDLLIPHEPISDEDVGTWFDGKLKPGSVIVIDEVQRMWRPRAASQTPPPAVAKLETHRHQGIDFIIITQHPQLIDVNVRRLVGRHLHVRRTFALGAAVVYEWDHCENPGNVKQATSKLWRYPKAAFKLYRSSELHTKAGGKMPLAVWVAIAAVLITPFLVWKGADRLLNGFAGTDPAKTAAKGAAAPAGGSKDARRPMTANELVAFYKPRVDGMAYTAPAYDGLTTPKRVPLPAACVDMKSKGCKCYTQDATPFNADEALCRTIVAGGIFLAFTEEAKAEGRDVKPPPRESYAQVPASEPVFIGNLPSENVNAKSAPPPAPMPPQQRINVANR